MGSNSSSRRNSNNNTACHDEACCALDDKAARDAKASVFGSQHCASPEAAAAPATLAAQIAAATAATPATAAIAVARTLSALDVALPVAWHAGPTAARAMRVACVDLCNVTREVFTMVLQWCPGCIYVCGGTDGGQMLSSVDRFNPVAGAWEVAVNMPQAREGAAAAGVEGKLYVCGGTDGAVPLNSIECFDPVSSGWAAAGTIPQMLQRRHRPVAAATGGVLCVMGGRDEFGHHQAAECLDLSTVDQSSWAPNCTHAAWTELAPMLCARHGAVAATISGVIYVAGGFDGRQDLNSAEFLSTSTHMWQQLPNMSARRHGPLAAAIGTNWYVCGGFDGPRLGNAEFFDTVANTWNRFPNMPEWRRGAVAAAVAGRLYVCGGQSSFWDDALYLNSVDRFDPSSNRWESLEVVLRNESQGNPELASASLHDSRRNAAAATIAV